MNIVNVQEAKTHLTRILKLVEAGETVIIANAGTPVADIVSHRKSTLQLGVAKGELTFDDETFDDMDKDIIDMFEVN